MAYMNQERKAIIQKSLEKFLDKRDGWKFSLRVRNHSTVVLTIYQGPVDFIGNYRSDNNQARLAQVKKDRYVQVNPFWLSTQFSGDVLEVAAAILHAMNEDNYDNSDSHTDYFDVGWYVEINIGVYECPYLNMEGRS